MFTKHVHVVRCYRDKGQLVATARNKMPKRGVEEVVVVTARTDEKNKSQAEKGVGEDSQQGGPSRLGAAAREETRLSAPTCTLSQAYQTKNKQTNKTCYYETSHRSLVLAPDLHLVRAWRVLRFLHRYTKEFYKKRSQTKGKCFGQLCSSTLNNR